MAAEGKISEQLPKNIHVEVLQPFDGVLLPVTLTRKKLNQDYPDPRECRYRVRLSKKDILTLNPRLNVKFQTGYSQIMLLSYRHGEVATAHIAFCFDKTGKIVNIVTVKLGTERGAYERRVFRTTTTPEGMSLDTWYQETEILKPPKGNVSKDALVNMLVPYVRKGKHLESAEKKGIFIEFAEQLQKTVFAIERNFRYEDERMPSRSIHFYKDLVGELGYSFFPLLHNPSEE